MVGEPAVVDDSRVAERRRLLQYIGGYSMTCAMYTAAKLELADHLARMKDRRGTAAELADKCGAHAPSLYRLMRMLASVGIFAEEDDGKFGFTPLAEYLRQDNEDSLWPVAMMTGEEHYLVYGKLVDAVRTGQTMFEEVAGAPVFEFLSKNPEKGRVFDAAMNAFHGDETAQMLAAYDFSQVRTLADVGGGNGSVLIAALQANPHLRGMLYDLRPVIDRARPRIEAAGLADRCQLVAGNFFEGVAAGADAYLMRHIIHDWDDAKCGVILANIHRVMPDDGRLLVIDTVIPKGNAPWFGKILDLTMLLMPGGKERTADEFRALLAASRFELTRIVPTRGEVSIVEGRKR